MATCLSASDWTATWDGTEGVVGCGQCRGCFRVSRFGVTTIIWLEGPEPGPHYRTITHAAREATERAVKALVKE
jgi:hypothetical protein